MEKLPDENPDNVERSNREKAERVLAKIMEREPNSTREEAKKRYIAVVPEVAKWLN